MCVISFVSHMYTCFESICFDKKIIVTGSCRDFIAISTYTHPPRRVVVGDGIGYKRVVKELTVWVDNYRTVLSFRYGIGIFHSFSTRTAAGLYAGVVVSSAYYKNNLARPAAFSTTASICQTMLRIRI